MLASESTPLPTPNGVEPTDSGIGEPPNWPPSRRAELLEFAIIRSPVIQSRAKRVSLRLIHQRVRWHHDILWVFEGELPACSSFSGVAPLELGHADPTASTWRNLVLGCMVAFAGGADPTRGHTSSGSVRLLWNFRSPDGLGCIGGDTFAFMSLPPECATEIDFAGGVVNPFAPNNPAPTLAVAPVTRAGDFLEHGV
ncbi:hypothetical protein BV22DRAFT_1133589 [Leucogyrophana mollusca]|uniref:Uncharacterized protein n=1 Tax=Leucogyrophana mollusca TaxID=85980 RepID=A0ACB8B292_9AGAM|nr:hypothetical protein BV22DRAFT_1133589 [Leucogyrophana mollusca]